MNISAIVMASGLSRRMNQNKLHMKIEDKKIYEYILETLKKCSSLSEVIVVANDSEILEKANTLNFKTVFNQHSYLGQSNSINLGLEASAYADGYMFFVADQPFIREDTIDKICNIFNDNLNKIIIPCYNDRHGNPVIFSSRFRDELMNIEGDMGGRVVINNNIQDVIKLQFEDEKEFIDIDTIEDYNNVKMFFKEGE